jgi:hypothetical protein
MIANPLQDERRPQVKRHISSAPKARIVAMAITAAALTMPPAATAAGPVATPASALEEIHILRSIREPHEPVADWCSPARTGFAPFPADAERLYSFWSLRLRPEDGRVLDAHDTRVAQLRACFGATAERARQNFYAEIALGGLSFRGTGECVALQIDTPEPGLFPVRCHLILGGLPAPYAGGVLTTNTLTSKAGFGGDTDPPGYTQASIATIRLWRARPAP